MGTNALNFFIGKRIKDLRKERGLTLRDLGHEVRRSFQHIQKYEVGQHRIPAYVLYRIAKALDVSVADFFPEKKESRSVDSKM